MLGYLTKACVCAKVNIVEQQPIYSIAVIDLSRPTRCSKKTEACVCGSGSAGSTGSAPVRPCTFCVRDVNQSKLSCLRDEKRKDAFFMKAKRLVSLLMALVFMIGIIAVPAMAATPDTADPQAQTIECPKCGGAALTSFKYEETGYYEYQLCSVNWFALHRHYEYKKYKCASCYCGYSTPWRKISSEWIHTDERW